MTGCIIVSTRDRPLSSIKAPKPNVSNRIAHYLARSPKIALTPSSFCNLPKIARSTILPNRYHPKSLHLLVREGGLRLCRRGFNRRGFLPLNLI
ncbi:MAG: hypothetical protein LH628_19250 [Microcoleus sp. CAN_BIN18]|nr:hypothetical protein [Microcoleus sp. CAN_BIN18]